jgi:pimeloyl-ACP methyl ester carboxylesterase
LEVVVVERPGFPPNPPVARVDFEADAALVAGWLRDGDHLVGHSYGGVVSLLAAADRPDALRSLTVIEPPATRVAAGNDDVDAFAAGGRDLYASAAADGDPEVFLRSFLAAVGSALVPPSPLPPELEQGARALMVERGPWEAEIPLEVLAAAEFPKLVVSGNHHPAFDAICDVLEERLGAERVVLEGFGHTAQRHPDFNAVLADFVERAAASARAAGTPPPRSAK